ncbi:MAG: SRPBCC family protein [Gammaproteobacteria bacterium]
MAANLDVQEPAQLETAGPVELTRLYKFNRAQVYAAWTRAEHLQRWFAPDCFTVPFVTLDPRAGGTFDLCMRSPQGTDHWMRGRFLELVPDERVVFESRVTDAADSPLFTATTTVTLTQDPCGTRVDVSQRYVLHQTIARQMIGGAREGWTQTLRRLDEALEEDARSFGARTAVHATFRLERRYKAAPARVFHALTDPEAKAAWFGGGATVLERRMDVRVGGAEYLKGQWEGGATSTFDCHYYDVVPNERLVYTYEMFLNERKISVSLATFELRADGTGTQVVLTEQGVFLDGYDDAGSREHGTNYLLDALGKAVDG